MFKHETINNKIIVKFFLEEIKIDFCKLSLLMPPNHCLLVNFKMNHLIAIKTTKNMANKAMKTALIFHMHLTLFSAVTYFLTQI